MSAETDSLSGRGRELRLLPGLVAILAAYVVYSGTLMGPGLTPDAMGYMRAANLLATGGHWVQLPNQWPPGFAIFLALGQSVTGDFFVGARILQAVIAATNVLLFCGLLERGGLSRSYACLTALLLLVQPAFLDVHLMLWSEPAFLCMLMLDLLLLQQVLDDGARPRRWIWLGLVCGMAIMQRYAGLFLLPFNAAAILLWSGSDGGRRRRLLSATIVSGLSVMPLLGWILFNHARGQSATSRTLGWHPAGPWHLAHLLHTVASWARVPLYLAPLVILALVAALVFSLWVAARDRSKASLASASLSLCVLSYMAFLWLSISLADNATPFDERLLSPIFPLCLAVLAILAAHALARRRSLVIPLAALFAWLLFFGGQVGWQNWHRSRTQGVSLSSREYRDMPVLAQLRSLPMQAHVLSNGPEILEIYLHRETPMLPSKVLFGSALPDPNYPRAFADALSSTDVVVYFFPMAGRIYLATYEEIGQVPGLRKVYDGPDAVVWVKVPVESSAGGDRP